MTFEKWYKSVRTNIKDGEINLTRLLKDSYAAGFKDGYEAAYDEQSEYEVK